MWIYGLSAGTTYYVGIKALDEVSNASTIATASAATPAASNLTRPLLQPDDFEYLGAFKLPQSACGWSTAYSLSGIALRRVNGNLQFLAGTHVYADGVYECNFPGWGSDVSTWPQSTLIREWGMDVYAIHRSSRDRRLDGRPELRSGDGPALLLVRQHLLRHPGEHPVAGLRRAGRSRPGGLRVRGCRRMSASR